MNIQSLLGGAKNEKQNANGLQQNATHVTYFCLCVSLNT